MVLARAVCTSLLPLEAGGAGSSLVPEALVKLLAVAGVGLDRLSSE